MNLVQQFLIFLVGLVISVAISFQIGITDDTWISFKEAFLVLQLIDFRTEVESYSIIGFLFAPILRFFDHYYLASNLIIPCFLFFIFLNILKHADVNKNLLYFLSFSFPFFSILPIGSIYVDFISVFFGLSGMYFTREPDALLRSAVSISFAILSFLIKPSFGFFAICSILLISWVNRDFILLFVSSFFVPCALFGSQFLLRDMGFLLDWPMRFGADRIASYFYLPFKIDGYFSGQWNFGFGSLSWIGIGCVLVVLTCFKFIGIIFDFLNGKAIRGHEISFLFFVWMSSVATGRGQGGVLFMLLFAPLFLKSRSVSVLLMVMAYIGILISTSSSLVGSKVKIFENLTPVDCRPRYGYIGCDFAESMVVDWSPEFFLNFDDSNVILDILTHGGNLRRRANYTYGISCSMSAEELQELESLIKRFPVGTTILLFPKGEHGVICRTMLDSERGRERVARYNELIERLKGLDAMEVKVSSFSTDVRAFIYVVQ